MLFWLYGLFYFSGEIKSSRDGNVKTIAEESAGGEIVELVKGTLSLSKTFVMGDRGSKETSLCA